MWSGLMTNSIGEERAKAFLDAHETRPNQASDEFNMDNANNSAGIAAASKMIEDKTFSVEDLERMGIQKLKDKELTVIRPTGKVRSDLGEPDGYYENDGIAAYILTPELSAKSKPKANVWQVIFLPSKNWKTVREVKIHKNCCS